MKSKVIEGVKESRIPSIKIGGSSAGVEGKKLKSGRRAK
jgi:hypothetical protein